MYYMKKLNDRLNKIITIRITDDDYDALLRISKWKNSNVSDIIRLIIGVVIHLSTKNNYKIKEL